jgi:hypothetical protein
VPRLHLPSFVRCRADLHAVRPQHKSAVVIAGAMAALSTGAPGSDLPHEHERVAVASQS